MSGEITIGKIASPILKFATGGVLKHFKNKRRKALLEGLESCDYTIDSPEIQKDEFIVCYLATEQAVFKSVSQTKLNALISLFLNSLESKKIFEQSDQYIEVLSIVSELSERELVILFWIFKFEEKYKRSISNKEQGVKKQLDFLNEKTGLGRELLRALIIRIKRTGLLLSENDLLEKKDMIMSGNDTIYLSQLAIELKDWIMFTIDHQKTNPFNIKRDSL
ncbi:MAG: hypothetical protein MJE63_17295 [Proteobacteria bacterium]|nr:hypothetical protein [Pseudomonadota bacterium]